MTKVFSSGEWTMIMFPIKVLNIDHFHQPTKSLLSTYELILLEQIN